METRRLLPCRALRLLLSLALCLAACQVQAARLALVIGNDQYHAVTPLKNARNDARLMAGALQQAGFEVTLASDLTREGLWNTLDTFKGRINKGDEAVFYFAGHGVQVGAAQMLLPTDIKAQNEAQIQRDGVQLVDVQDALKDARVAVLIIDACRDNPFPRQGTRSIGATRGLLPPEPATGQIIMMSAGRNQRALDSVPGQQADNGLFTWQLVQTLRTPGVEIRAALEQVKDAVDDLARKVGHEQRPSLVNDLRGSYYFQGAAAAAPVPAPVPVPPPARPAGTGVAAVAPPPGPAAAAAGSATAPGQVLRDCAHCPELVVLPGGRFQMGSPPAEQALARAGGIAPGLLVRETPLREVSVPAFAAGRGAVTRKEFAAFVQARGYRSDAERDGGCSIWTGVRLEMQAARNWRNSGFDQEDDHPVVCVSWSDAQAYVQWLRQTTGKPYRLLTESEREYAARGGTQTAFWWGNEIRPDQANYNPEQTYNGSSRGGYRQITLPALGLDPNPYGLHHVHGNVWEWVQDCFHDGNAGMPNDGSAWAGACVADLRILRGGSWDFAPAGLRSAYRHGFAASGRSQSVGFRVARGL